MHWTDLNHELENIKNTLDLPYTNFDVKMNFSMSSLIIQKELKKWQKPIAEVLEETGRTENPEICMKMVNWVLQQQGIDIFKILQNSTPFWFFEKTEYFEILAISKIHYGSNMEYSKQKMHWADLNHELEKRKNTLDLPYTNFDAKMNFSISSLIIQEGIEKMAKTYRWGVRRNWKDPGPRNLHKDGKLGASTARHRIF